MPQVARVLQPELSPVHLFGSRLRTLREERGLSQRELGRSVFCSGHLIGKIEKGERRPHEELVRRCDATLGAANALVDLFHEAVAPSRRSTPSAGAYASVPELRRALNSRDLPAGGLVRPLAQLRGSVSDLVACRLDSRYAELAQRLIVVLPELHRANLRGGAEVSMLLAQAYRCVDAIADKLGLYDLSARTIDLMRAAAEASGDEITIAASSYVRAETFFATCDWSAGQRMLDRAAAELNPAASTPAMAAYGALTMRAAVLAARAGRADQAAERIAEATGAAAQVPEGIYHGTAFGPASVRIHRLALAVDLQDVGGALAASAAWTPPLAIPAERRSHFFVELARAHVAASHDDTAVHYLTVARQVAPEQIRDNTDVKATLSQLVARTSKPTTALRGLMRWTGLITEAAV